MVWAIFSIREGSAVISSHGPNEGRPVNVTIDGSRTNPWFKQGWGQSTGSSQVWEEENSTQGGSERAAGSVTGAEAGWGMDGQIRSLMREFMHQRIS